jgi:hypothetical protein
MRTQRQAQTVADALALAGAQSLPDAGAVDDAVADYADLNNWSIDDVTWTPEAGASTLHVRTERAAPGLFGDLVGEFDFTISAEARATVAAPSTLTKVAPLALECPGDCDDPSELLGGQFTFRFRGTQPWSPGDGTHGFGPFDSGGLTSTDLATYLGCDPAEPAPSSCWSDELTVPQSFELLDTDDDGDGHANELSTMLEDALGLGSWPRLVGIYDDYNPGSGFDLIGWAAFTITDVRTTGPTERDVRLSGRFDRFLVPGTSISSSGTGNEYDFGVHAVALTD